MEKNFVTIQSVEEFNFAPVHVTDYAIAKGVACHQKQKIDGVTARTPEHISLKNHYYAYKICTAINGGVGGQMRNYFVPCEDTNSAIMPRFCPNIHGIGTQIVKDHAYLTFDKTVLTYPRTYVGKSLQKDLNKNLATGAIKSVGSFNDDHVFVFKGKKYCFVEHAKSVDSDSSFRDGAFCEKNDGYWFACEPLPVRCVANGSIQCTEAVINHRFSYDAEFMKLTHDCDGSGKCVLNTDDFEIGKFLNETFLNDLLRNAGLSLKTQQEIIAEAENFVPCAGVTDTLSRMVKVDAPKDDLLSKLTARLKKSKDDATNSRY